MDYNASFNNKNICADHKNEKFSVSHKEAKQFHSQSSPIL